MGGYEVRVEPGKAFDGNMTLRDTWNGSVVYVEDDGRETRTGITSCYWQRDDHNKRRTRAKLNIQLGRLRAYAKRNGKRWEVERAAEAAAKRQAEKEEADARRRVRSAAPDLLEALQLCVIRDPSLEANAMVMNAIAKAEGRE